MLFCSCYCLLHLHGIYYCLRHPLLGNLFPKCECQMVRSDIIWNVGNTFSMRRITSLKQYSRSVNVKKLFMAQDQCNHNCWSYSHTCDCISFLLGCTKNTLTAIISLKLFDNCLYFEIGSNSSFGASSKSWKLSNILVAFSHTWYKSCSRVNSKGSERSEYT